MHVITNARLKEFYKKHPDAEGSLRDWYKRAKTENWRNLTEIRETYPHADFVSGLTIFNISGNKYRLITRINFKRQKIFIRHVLSHAEYDKENWKNDPWIEKT